MTFRLPGPLAIAVATVDAMSGGRVELGLGSGWYETEHQSYGIPFPPVRRAVRPAGGAARDRHRAVGHPARRDVLVPRRALHADRQPGAAEAGAVAVAGRGRRQGEAAHARARGAVRRGVQRRVRHDRRRGRLLRPGARGLRGGRPRPGVAGAVGRADPGRRVATRQRYAGAPRPSAATRTSCGRAAVSSAARPRSWTRSAGSASWARAASTCRCWTSATSTTCGWWPTRSPRTSEPRSAAPQRDTRDTAPRLDYYFLH